MAAETFRQPTRLRNSSGEERRAGFEFEFAGLDTKQTITVITELYGGSIREKNRFDMEVEDSRLGKFSVALDARTIKDESYLELLRGAGVNTHDDRNRNWWEDIIESVAAVAVPYEIGCPPIRFSQLHELEALRETLREKEALGTGARLHYAFGLHLNPEIPDETVESTLNILRSFLIHYPWLLKKLNIDIARRVTPFINPFPDEYFRLVLDAGYQPDQERFIQDYLAHNPTRNRPLDLLPILSHWNGDWIKKALPEEKIKARPTYHYRMPNCLLDDPHWRLAHEWNYWVQVEDLAVNGARLKELALDLTREMAQSPLRWSSIWAARLEKEL